MFIRRNIPEIGFVWTTVGGLGQFGDLPKDVPGYFERGIELKAGAQVIDVGANIGVFALSAAARCADVRLHCFEPIPETFLVLEKNVRGSELLTEKRAKLHNVGLTRIGGPEFASFTHFRRLPCDTTQHLEEKHGEFAAFFEQRAADLERRLGRWGRLVGSVLVSLTGSRVGRWIVDTAAGSTKVQCALSTLSREIDRFGIERIDLLKIDVEGAELDVLLGIEERHWPLIEQVTLEGHDIDGRLRAIEDLFAKAGLDRIEVSVPELARERGLNNFMIWATRSAKTERATPPSVDL